MWQRNQVAIQTHHGGSAGSKTASEGQTTGEHRGAGSFPLSRGSIGMLGLQNSAALVSARVQTSTPPLPSTLGLRTRELHLPSPLP